MNKPVMAWADRQDGKQAYIVHDDTGEELLFFADELEVIS